MSTPQELERKLWKALSYDRVVMLGVDGAENGHTHDCRRKALAGCRKDAQEKVARVALR
jgi:hypothetical protein